MRSTRPEYDRRVSNPGRLIRDFYRARASGDRTAVPGLIVDDVAWHDPYPPPHGGDLLGRAAVLRDVFDAAGELTGSSSRLWLIDQVSLGRLGCGAGRVVVRLPRERDGSRELAVYRVERRSIAEAWFYPEEPVRSWRFFTDTAEVEPSTKSSPAVAIAS
jgi:hypothetical protein